MSTTITKLIFTSGRNSELLGNSRQPGSNLLFVLQQPCFGQSFNMPLVIAFRISAHHQVGLALARCQAVRRLSY